jgi:hypothetical protein
MPESNEEKSSLRRTAEPRQTLGFMPRAVSGSLPLDLISNGKEDVWQPAVVFAPPHLRKAESKSLNDWQSGGSSVEGGLTAEPAAAKLRSSLLASESPALLSEPDPSDELFLEQSGAMLSSGSQQWNSRFGASASDASYDFNEYMMLRHPDDALPNGSNVLFPSDPKFQLLLNEADKAIAAFIEGVSLRYSHNRPQIYQYGIGLKPMLYSWWFQVCAMRAFNQLHRYSRSEIKEHAYNATPYEYYGQSLSYYLLSSSVRGEVDAYLAGNGNSSKLQQIVTAAFWEKVMSGVFEEYFDRNGIPQVDPYVPDGEYPFDPYPAHDVFFGLQVVNRQSWRLLGYARSELVKSIPLGPKETQKVSVKIHRRTKTTHSSEESSSYETSSDNSTTSKDTSEVVAEASQKLNMHAEAEVSGGYGPFVQAKVSGGIAQDTASSSKDTKTRLNEMMQKTASKMKRDTKVTVSSETEVTFEDSRSSELTNPNDEIAVTYLYHRLQQRYWVSTEIAEVNSVVFVPEPIPDWHAINEEWIEQHGDILAGALLDPDFGPILATICKEPANLEYSDSSKFMLAVDAGIKAAADYKGFTGGGAMPDLLASGQAAYERQYERENHLRMDQRRRAHQTERLLVHIRRNILHYMRAIWASEDYDQKMQRYSRMRVATEWSFVPSGLKKGNPLEVEGTFVPSAGSARPLTEVINPIGPIGYLFNCAIYQLRDHPKLANLNQALAYLRSTYARFAVQASASSPALTVRQAVCYEPRSFAREYTLTYRQKRGKWLIPTSHPDEMDWLVVGIMPDGSLDALGFRIWLDGTPADGDKLTVSIRITGDLEDPHLRMLRMQYPLPAAEEEASFFTPKLLREMADVLPELSLGYDPAEWSNLDTGQQGAYRSLYHQFLMMRESGRLVTLDTANLVLDLEISQSPALEPFKRLHRYIDVKKEYEEYRRRALDNERRARLLDKAILGDPDIERIALITDAISKDQVASAEALEELDSDTDSKN